jgi:2-oxoglutarate dehydrogenase E2 component (dihydrolipoamide succinyltransferase)
MPTEIKVPTLGESVTTATIARWMKHPGDAVAADEPLVELETDKVTVEVGAPAAGVLTAINFPEGAEVEVGALLGMLDGETGTAPRPVAPAPAAMPVPAMTTSAMVAPAPAMTTPAPAMAGSTPAMAVQASATAEPASEMAAQASALASPAPVTATPVAPVGRAAANPPAGVNPPPRPLGPVTRPATSAPLSAPVQAAAPVSMAPPAQPVHDPLPAAAMLMQEQRLVPAAIGPGSGKDGRITKGDVLAFLNRPAPAAANPAAPAAAAISARAADPREQRVRMTRLRRTIATRLKEAQNTAAMLTTFNEVDMSAVMALRAEYRDAFEKKHNGVRLGFMSFFVRACCVALKEFPAVNGEVDGDDIVYKNYVNMGIAVGGPSGLVVPVIRDADTLGFAGIEAAIADFGKRARDGHLKLDDLTGGTFSITNGGIYGSLMSTPILNPPQSAILGMHKIQDRPMAVAGKIEIRPMMYLAVSYDHRIVDGKEAVSFLVRVKEGVEDPRRLLLDV